MKIHKLYVLLSVDFVMHTMINITALVAPSKYPASLSECLRMLLGWSKSAMVRTQITSIFFNL